MNIDFNEALKRINNAYKDIGHNLGFRFLYSSKSTFYSKIIFMNLNPGGDEVPIDHPWDSCEDGPAHLTEKWDAYPIGKHPLQIQVQKLFSLLSDRIPGEENLIYTSMLTNFIPFRSKSFNDLKDQKESIKFSLQLWKDILFTTKPKILICTGNVVFNNLLNIYGSPTYIYSTKLSWGKVFGDVYIYNDNISIVRFPNLSRYKIFSHPKSLEPVQKLLEKATKNYK